MFRLYRLILSSSALFLLCSSANAAQNNCGVGSFYNGSSCKLCSKGTYGDQRKATSCKPCPKGTFGALTGLQGVDTCEPCPPGTLGTVAGASSQSACKPCPKGKSSVPGALTCIACKPGSFISTSVENPADPASRISKCFPCTFENFSDKANSLMCQRCKTGTMPNKAHTACQKCPPGSGPTISRSHVEFGLSCELCYEGTFGVGGTRLCERCPDGFQPNRRRGADKCELCPPGTASESFASPYCRPCKNGGNKNVTGGTLCVPPHTPCPPKYFFNSRGACQTCKKGERCDVAKKTCVSCGDDAESEGGISKKCTRCPANNVGSPDGCVCSPGRELLPDGSCRLCAAGTFQLYSYDSLGSVPTSDLYSVCEDCPFGSFSLPGSTECSVCPTGKVVKKDRSGCEECPKGTKGRARDGYDGTVWDIMQFICVDPRTNCPPEQERVVLSKRLTVIALEEMAQRCQAKSCPSGTNEGFWEHYIAGEVVLQMTRFCESCPPGEAFNKKYSECTGCGDGISQGGTTKCKKCPKGLFQSANGRDCKCTTSDGISRGLVNGKCQECPAGSRGAANRFRRDQFPDLDFDFSGCVPCAPGFIQEEKGEDFCRRCPAGTFTSKPGSVRCNKCPPGSISFGRGDSSCVVVGSLKKGGKRYVTR